MNEFVIIVESAADFRIASTIANRIFVEQIDWLEEILPQLVEWSGLQAGTNFSCWKDLKSIEDAMKNQGIHLPRYLGGSDRTLKADGAAALKVLRMIGQIRRQNERSIKAVVLIRDLDNQPRRRQSLEQARQEQASIITVIGTPDSKREAWVLNGFVCLNEQEEAHLAELCKQLEFDPALEAHRLRATTFDEPDRSRNAKVVLDRLTRDDRERESQCWETTDLRLLRERGAHTGLTTYMNEVEERLVPLLLKE